MKIVKLISLCLWIGILLLPLSQNIFQYAVVKPLNGAFINPVRPALATRSWFNSSFQDSMNQFVESNLGFRPLLVRVRNQIDYSLFGITHANDIIKGRNGQLFEKTYVEKYYGMNTAYQDSLPEVIGQLKFLQDTLAKENKLVMVVIAPGKAHFMPENIPPGFDSSNIKNSNYNKLVPLLKDHQINFIDFNSYFLSIKNDSHYPLFPAGGTHWSVYGAMLAADSMTKFIKEKLGIPIISYDISHGFWSLKPQQGDDDILSTINLLLTPKGDLLWYPWTEIDTTTGLKPDVLVIGDSYYWRILGNYFPLNVYSSRFSYWYYGAQAWPESERMGRDVMVSNMNLKDEIEKRQVIIFLDGEANYTGIGHGLIAKMYALYHPK